MYSSCNISSAHCNCFEKLTAEQLEELEANSVNVYYKKGETVCKQGAYASYVVYLTKGLAKVFLEDGSNSLVLKIVPGGSLVGLTSLSDYHPTFQYSAMTYVDSEVKQIEISFFKKLIYQNPDFAKEVIDILTSNSVQVNGRFFCLTCKQSYGRLADIILCLSERIFGSGEFDVPLSRKDLADLSGMGPETVIRMLKSFKDEGLIEMKGKSLRILDIEKLRRISETG